MPDPRAATRVAVDMGWRQTDVWVVDEGDVWFVMCMNCGTRIGTVNVGNKRGAFNLTDNHERTLGCD